MMCNIHINTYTVQINSQKLMQCSSINCGVRLVIGHVGYVALTLFVSHLVLKVLSPAPEKWLILC